MSGRPRIKGTDAHDQQIGHDRVEEAAKEIRRKIKPHHAALLFTNIEMISRVAAVEQYRINPPQAASTVRALPESRGERRRNPSAVSVRLFPPPQPERRRLGVDTVHRRAAIV